MKNGKMTQAMGHIEDALIAEAMDGSDMQDAQPKMKRGNKMKGKFDVRRWIAIAAIFAVVISASFLIAGLAGKGGAVVALDVNPSIELEVNGREKVSEARALNADAEAVLSGLDLEDVDLNVALYAILGSMLEKGYLSTEQNSILISVDAKNDSRARELQKKLTEQVGDRLAANNIEASVITQSFDKDKRDEVAEENAISHAKSALIKKILASGMLDANGIPYTYEALARLMVNELKLILDSKRQNVGGIVTSGAASDGKYLSREEAKALALADAGVSAENIVHESIEIDYDDDVRAMVYEIEFCADGMEYEYELLAEKELAAGAERILEREVKREEHRDGDEHVDAPQGAITREEALAIVYDDAGVSASDVRRPEIELDTERGVVVYEIEFKTATTEYEYTVNVLTGEIMERESERRD